MSASYGGLKGSLEPSASYGPTLDTQYEDSLCVSLCVSLSGASLWVSLWVFTEGE